MKPNISAQEYDNKNAYIRRLIFAAGLVFVALLQNTGGLLPSFFGFRAMPLIPAVVCIAMFEREMTGMFFGVFAGLLWDSTASTHGHFHAILLTCIAFACSALITHLFRNNIITASLFSGGALLVYNVVCIVRDLVIGSHWDAGYKILTFYIPSGIYSLLFVVIFYFLVRAVEKKFPDR